MQKPSLSILSTAGQQSLSLSLHPTIPLTPRHQNPTSSSQYHKSSIADNLLQEMDDDYEEIEGYESKFVDEEGRVVGEVEVGDVLGVEKRVSGQQRKQFVVKKDKNSKNRFAVDQHIVQEAHNQVQVQHEPIDDSPIKTLNKSTNPNANLPLPSQSKFSTSSNQLITLLRNYPKPTNHHHNKYEQQLWQYSQRKRNEKRAIRGDRNERNDRGNNSDKSYLTNSQGLKEEDFYRVDYMGTGKYEHDNSGNSNRMNGQYATAQFLFHPSHNDLSAIEDILSDINSLTQHTSHLKYTSSKIYPKSAINSIGQASSMSKYRGNRNFSGFGKSGNTRNDDQFGSRLDDLLMGYRFGGGDGGVVGGGNGSNPLEGGGLLGESGLSQSVRFDGKTKAGLRRMKREEEKKSSKGYQDVRNQIKYGIDEGDHEEYVRRRMEEQMQQQGKGRQKQQEQQEQQQQGAKTNNNNKPKNTQQEQQQASTLQDPTNPPLTFHQSPPTTLDPLTDPILSQLLPRLRLYHITWSEIPLIPCSCHQMIFQFKKYPLFTADQTVCLVGVLGKLERGKVETYSMFCGGVICGDGEVFGVKRGLGVGQSREVEGKGIQKGSSKPSKEVDRKRTQQDTRPPQSHNYRLLNKQQFLQQWKATYQNSTKQPTDKTLLLNQQQIEALIDFDLKWYKALVFYVFGRDLQSLVEREEGELGGEIGEKEMERFVAVVREMGDYYRGKQMQKMGMVEAISVNKLKLLKSVFGQIDLQSQDKQHQHLYSFGMIPSIITPHTPLSQQTLIKTYLKDNFRGGIYHITPTNPISPNPSNDSTTTTTICLLQMSRHKTLQIDQISTQTRKQVWINKKVVIRLVGGCQKNEGNRKKNEKQKGDVDEKEVFEICVRVGKEVDDKGDHEMGIRLSSYYNQIQFEVEEEVKEVKQGNIGFCKGFRVVLSLKQG